MMVQKSVVVINSSEVKECLCLDCACDNCACDKCSLLGNLHMKGAAVEAALTSAECVLDAGVAEQPGHMAHAASITAILSLG